MASEINLKLAELFEDVGNSLQFQGEAWVKVRSYLHVAQVLRSLAEPADQLVREGRLERVEGVGKAISQKIVEYLRDGTFPLLERLDEQIPAGVRTLVRAGVAPSLIRHLLTVGHDTREKLDAAIDEGRLTEGALPARLRSKLREYRERRTSA